MNTAGDKLVTNAASALPTNSKPARCGRRSKKRGPVEVMMFGSPHAWGSGIKSVYICPLAAALGNMAGHGHAAVRGMGLLVSKAVAQRKEDIPGRCRVMSQGNLGHGSRPCEREFSGR
jgi:hypothetical protein